MKNVKLYNVLFPLWMLMMFPICWLIVLPGNFIIDSAVLFISLYALKVPCKKDWYKKHILKIFLFGMISDVIGATFMLCMVLSEFAMMGDELYITIPALVISALFIFLFNYFITFRKEEKALCLKLSLIFAIVTAPYTFLVPSSWIYA